MIQTIKWKVQDMINAVKWAYQRVVRGYDDRLFWSLADYLDPMIVAHVRELRETGMGFPASLTQKKWNKVLDTILKGFQEDPLFLDTKEWKKYHKDRQKALALLAVYYDHLWD